MKNLIEYKLLLSLQKKYIINNNDPLAAAICHAQRDTAHSSVPLCAIKTPKDIQINAMES